MKNFFSKAVKEQPLGAIAIVVSLIPFIFEEAKDYIFSGSNLRIVCETPEDTEFGHEEGFLYYESRCLISNISREPVSLISIVPVMLHDDYPISLLDGSQMYPALERPYDSEIGSRYLSMTSEFPVYLSGRETFATDAVFFTSVGRMRPIKEKQDCSKNLEFDNLREVGLCFKQSRHEETGFNDTELQSESDAYPFSAKEQIYRGYSYGFVYVDGFGLEISLGDGTRYIVEADLTAVHGYRCNENIRELSCQNFDDDAPRVVNIGAEPDYSRFSWISFVFTFAMLVVVVITLQLLYFGLMAVVRVIKNYLKNQDIDGTGR